MTLDYQLPDEGGTIRTTGIGRDITERRNSEAELREGGGSGIGQAIVLNMIKLYGGVIGASNNGGACFEFTIGDRG